MLNEIQTEKEGCTMISLMWKIKSQQISHGIQGEHRWLPEARHSGWGKWVKMSQKTQAYSYK